MKNKRGYIKEWQVRKLIEYFKRQAEESNQDWLFERNMRKSLFIYMLWRTGRRVSELVGQPNYERVPGLRPIDIDYEHNEISFSILKKFPVRKKDKQGKERSEESIARAKFKKAKWEEAVPYPADIFKVLKYWIKRFNISKSERIFPYHRVYVDEFIKKAARELELKLSAKKIVKDKVGNPIEIENYISAHSFRHGFAINFLKKNKNDPAALPILQEMLVHSNLNVTKGYLNFDDTKKRELLDNAAK